jgi:hypothetical protein
MVGAYPKKEDLRVLSNSLVTSYICLDEIAEIASKRPYRRMATEIALSATPIKILHCQCQSRSQVQSTVATLVRELQLGSNVYVHSQEQERITTILVVFLCSAYGMDFDQACAYCRSRLPDLNMTVGSIAAELSLEVPAMEMAVDKLLPDWKLRWNSPNLLRLLSPRRKNNKRGSVCAMEALSELKRRTSSSTSQKRCFSVF